MVPRMWKECEEISRMQVAANSEGYEFHSYLSATADRLFGLCNAAPESDSPEECAALVLEFCEWFHEADKNWAEVKDDWPRPGNVQVCHRKNRMSYAGGVMDCLREFYDLIQAQRCPTTATRKEVVRLYKAFRIQATKAGIEIAPAIVRGELCDVIDGAVIREWEELQAERKSLGYRLKKLKPRPGQMTREQWNQSPEGIEHLRRLGELVTESIKEEEKLESSLCDGDYNEAKLLRILRVKTGYSYGEIDELPCTWYADILRDLVAAKDPGEQGSTGSSEFVALATLAPNFSANQSTVNRWVKQLPDSKKEKRPGGAHGRWFVDYTAFRMLPPVMAWDRLPIDKEQLTKRKRRTN